MRKIGKLLLILFALLPLCSFAQGSRVIRSNCMPELTEEGTPRAGGLRKALSQPRKDWDPARTYNQMVVLIEFSDCGFQMETPQATYDSIFNEPGFNKRNGPGCVADYFRAQSSGRLNLHFDVMGPVKVSAKSLMVENPTRQTKYYGNSEMVEAVQKVLADNPDVDYSKYDWDGDKWVDRVLIVYAGLTGNQDDSLSYGHIWPNTGSFTTQNVPGGLRLSSYTSSAELWVNGQSCGIGTICHEFSHSLGLPDIYPMSGPDYSVVDEWDLMDGGNFTNWGWCPPNYSPLEKMLLGWLTPVTLTQPTQVRGMRPVSDGGEVYRIDVDANEYYLLENRQWQGWDYGCPGQGLVIYHVRFNQSSWNNNKVNVENNYRYTLLHADGKDYNSWREYILAQGLKSQYQATPRLHNYHLSGSPYPWSTDSTETVNSALGNRSYPIVNISMDDEGHISFDFMGYDPTQIDEVGRRTETVRRRYDLSGRRMGEDEAVRGLTIEISADGSVRKVVR